MIYQYQLSFSDVDFARVLFFGRYYDVANRAWEHWLHRYGIYVRELHGQHDLRVPIVASFCRYLGPLYLEDVAEVHLGLKDLSPRGVTQAFVFYRQGQERPVAWGYVERRFVTGDGKPREAPELILRALETMAAESRAFLEQVWLPLANRQSPG